MNVENIRVGDICDAYLTDNPTQRVMITDVRPESRLVRGVNSKLECFVIEPQFEIENIIANINEM